MSYEVLYRKYRPTNFSEIVGQEIITKILVNAIKNNKISHAYVFFGPKGIGKTTIARLFAKAINCKKKTSDLTICNECEDCQLINNNNHPDVIEIDAASNNGVDKIRTIIENTDFLPVKGQYKIYIIDEVHMLSTNAFNALLKTLEEPHKNIIFILITTEMYKIPQTVISRCQKFNFTKISYNKMKEKILFILEKEKINISDKAIELIISMADGCLRDALTLLDQAIIYSKDKITEKEVTELFGLISKEKKIQLLTDIINKDIKSISQKINYFLENGINCRILITSLISILKDVLLYKMTFYNDMILTEIDKDEAKKISDYFSEETIFKMINILLESLKQAKDIIQDYKLLLELTFIKLINIKNDNLIKNQKVEKINTSNNDDQLIKIISNSNKDECDKLQNVWKLKISTLFKKNSKNMSETQKNILFLLNDSEPFAIDDKNLIITCNLESLTNKINKIENQKIINEIVNEITKKNIINTYAILKSQKEKYILKNNG